MSNHPTPSDFSSPDRPRFSSRPTHQYQPSDAFTQLPANRRASAPAPYIDPAAHADRFGRGPLPRHAGPPTDPGHDDGEDYYHQASAGVQPLNLPPRAEVHDHRAAPPPPSQPAGPASAGGWGNPFAGWYGQEASPPMASPAYDARPSMPPALQSGSFNYPGYSNAPPIGGQDRRASDPNAFFGQEGRDEDALRRAAEEEQIRSLAARQAADLVEAHLRGDFDRLVEARRGSEPYSGANGQGRATSQRAPPGILSNLLQLYGGQLAPGSGGRGLERTPTTSSTGDDDAKWNPPSGMSKRSKSFADEGAFAKTAKLPTLKRTDTTSSASTTATHFDDPDAPKEKISKPRVKKSKDKGLAADDLRHEEGVPVEKIKKSADPDEALREAARLLAAQGGMAEADVYEALKKSGCEAGREKKNRYKKNKRKLDITAHVASIIERQTFILKLAKALMTFGAPSHRLESQLNATAQVLQVDAQFIHVPSVVIASFGDTDTHTSETKFVKAGGGLNLGSLQAVHQIYRDVIHDEMSVEEGSVALSMLLKAKPIYNIAQRMCIAFMCAGIIAPMGFGGSFIDAFVAGAFGATLAFLQLHVARKNAVFANIFEISIACLISFVSRGLSTTNLFCYEALSSAGVVLVLPGYIVLCGSLELASRNLIAGSVRMVYSIIYVLFLGFAISVGSDFFFLFDPSARRIHDATAAASASTYTTDGTFSAMNGTVLWTGAWTFANASSSAIDNTQASLQKGNVMCVRGADWEWWRADVSAYWLFLLVPAFSFFLSLWNLQPIRSRELPVMVVISIVGYVANRVATTFVFNRSDIVSFIGATVIGLLGNLYSRLFNGTSFTAMATGVLFLVPSGIAAAGGLSMEGAEGYTSGLAIGLRMLQMAIGITIGLFFSSLLIYSVGTKKNSGGLGFAF